MRIFAFGLAFDTYESLALGIIIWNSTYRQDNGVSLDRTVMGGQLDTHILRNINCQEMDWREQSSSPVKLKLGA
jgi:hypothetical protein